METELVQVLIQYGIAGVALYMLYKIAYKKLDDIDQRLIELKAEIRVLREAIEKKGS